MNLRDARQQFLGDIVDGTICPLCDRPVQIYQRPIAAMLARFLETIYTHFGTEWVPTKKFPLIVAPMAPDGKAVSNYYRLKHFDLFMPHGTDAAWRVTRLGQQFLRGEVTASRQVKVCLNQRLASSVAQIGFQEAKNTVARNCRREIEMLPGALAHPDLPAIPFECINMMLDEARAAHLRAVLESRGQRCLICDQWNQRYRRTLNANMAAVLQRLAEIFATNPQYVHVYNMTGTRGGDYSKMLFWELIESSPNELGLWRITPKGLAFVAGEIVVPQAVTLLNNRFIGFSGREITFAEALATRFHEADLQPA